MNISPLFLGGPPRKKLQIFEVILVLAVASFSLSLASNTSMTENVVLPETVGSFSRKVPVVAQEADRLREERARLATMTLTNLREQLGNDVHLALRIELDAPLTLERLDGARELENAAEDAVRRGVFICYRTSYRDVSIFLDIRTTGLSQLEKKALARRAERAILLRDVRVFGTVRDSQGPLEIEGHQAHEFRFEPSTFAAEREAEDGIVTDTVVTKREVFEDVRL